MIGAIVGDIVGSKYEFHNIKTKDFPLFSEGCRFTDDTVMTIALFKALADCNGNYADLSNCAVRCMREYGERYLNAGYGKNFFLWIESKNPKPYNSLGNGAAMRVSSVAYFANSLDEVKSLSKKVTEVTHNHEEGLKGAEATAVAVWLALNGKKKEEIKEYIEKNYYSLDFDFKTLQQTYKYTLKCQDTVPQAIFCFLISTDFEDAIRNAVSIGGDCDTTGAICGAIAGAYYGVPEQVEKQALAFLDADLLSAVNEFKDIQKQRKTMNFRIEKKFPSNAEFNELFESVGWGGRDEDKINMHRQSNVFAVSIYDGDRIVGMVRVVGDGSYYTVYDVVVAKDYQGKGVGRLLMEEVVKWYKTIEDNDTYMYLGASKGREGVYEKFGFVARPYDGIGAGMKYDPEYSKKHSN